MLIPLLLSFHPPLTGPVAGVGAEILSWSLTWCFYWTRRRHSAFPGTTLAINVRRNRIRNACDAGGLGVARTRAIFGEPRGATVVYWMITVAADSSPSLVLAASAPSIETSQRCWSADQVKVHEAAG